MSYEDKMRIIFHEIGFGYWITVTNFPEKVWKISSVKAFSLFFISWLSLCNTLTVVFNVGHSWEVRHITLLTSENQTLNLMLYHFARYQLNVAELSMAYKVLRANWARKIWCKNMLTLRRYPRSTQPGHPFVGSGNEYQRKLGRKQAHRAMH